MAPCKVKGWWYRWRKSSIVKSTPNQTRNDNKSAEGSEQTDDLPVSVVQNARAHLELVEENKDKSDKPSQPLSHPDFVPAKLTPVLNLPVHYWFYVYTPSGDCDRLLEPIIKAQVEAFPTDRRLIAIMNRCQVSVRIGHLELYKSLPRRVLVVRGASWHSIVRAVKEMESFFPQLMRFATYPESMKFSSTPTVRNYRQTAPQTRITG